MLKKKMQAQEFSQKKKIDMPIKKLLLKIWLAASFPSPMDTLSKENMVDFFSPLPVFDFQLKVNINWNTTWILAKSNPRPPPSSFFLKEEPGLTYTNILLNDPWQIA